MKCKVVFVSLLVLLLLRPAAAIAQTDVTIHQFFLPGTNRSGYRVHASDVHLNVTVLGGIFAERGYKVALNYSHGGRVVVNSANIAVPIAGTVSGATLAPSLTGVLYHRMPDVGSVIGVALQSSVALTAGTATAEATIISMPGAVVYATNLTVAIGPAQFSTQYWMERQPRGRDAFVAGQLVGCRLTTTSTLLPTSAELLCTVLVEY